MSSPKNDLPGGSLLPAEESDSYIDPIDSYLATENAPLPPIGPDGGFAPVPSFMPEPIPPATIENMICLRGPCRHYTELNNSFPAGNAAGTFDRPPVQISRYCSALQPSFDLTDEVMYDCNRWSPLRGFEIAALEDARKEWYDANPDFRREEGGN